MLKFLATFFSAFLLFLFISPAEAQPPPRDPLEEILAKVRSMEERVKKIEANQQEILSREEKILAELDRLRIWVRRNP